LLPAGAAKRRIIWNKVPLGSEFLRQGICDYFERKMPWIFALTRFLRRTGNHFGGKRFGALTP